MDRCVRFAVPVVAALVACACSTVNPYTGEAQTSKAAKGAGYGAAAGAVIGLLTKGDELENALIGAGVGAVAGGGFGYYMDVQEAKLRQQMAGTGVTVTRTGQNVTLNMPGNVTFAIDSADLRPEFFQVLNGVAMVLDEYESTVIEIAGQTDSTGSDAYNQQLSERRARTVADYLGARGIQPTRLLPVGAGERYPIAENDNAEGRQLNRRVELTIVPVTA
jgi:outer membrane protein OmpA-like peptidoglycan-associated protein